MSGATPADQKDEVKIDQNVVDLSDVPMRELLEEMRRRWRADGGLSKWWMRQLQPLMEINEELEDFVIEELEYEDEQQHQ